MESELVSGFMTEHAAVVFVFFFLAEYASIILICLLSATLFLGGYLYDYSPLPIYFFIHWVQFFNFDYYLVLITSDPDILLDIDTTRKSIFYALAIAIKTGILIFIFIWARASFPRIRFDQLMSYCWTILLPLVIAYIILVPCILYGFEILPANIYLL